ncbi:MAG: hypothetical protein ACXIU8_08455 [Alkalilacustris sp.]
MARPPAPARPAASPPDQAHGPTVKTVLKHAISVVASAGVTLALVWMLLGTGQGFDLGWEGARPSIKVAAREEALGRVLRQALEDNPQDTRAILRGLDFHPTDNIPPERMRAILTAQRADHSSFIRSLLGDMGYYEVSNIQIVSALAQLSPDAPVAVELRSLLFDMRGPFAHPATLEGARSRFLTEVLQRLPQNNALVRELWSDLIRRPLAVVYPDLHADLVPVDIPAWTRAHDRGPLVRNAAACPGSDLERKFVQILLPPDDGGIPDQVMLYVTATLGAHECRGTPLHLVEFADTHVPRLGLARSHYDSLRAKAGTGPLRYEAVVYPAGLAPFDVLEVTAAGPGEGDGTEDDDAG